MYSTMVSHTLNIIGERDLLKRNVNLGGGHTEATVKLTSPGSTSLVWHLLGIEPNFSRENHIPHREHLNHGLVFTVS